jgi:transposase-like protein
MAYRTFKLEFKRRVVEEWCSGQRRMAEVCRQYQLSDSLVRRWREDATRPPGVRGARPQCMGLTQP